MSRRSRTAKPVAAFEAQGNKFTAFRSADGQDLGVNELEFSETVICQARHRGDFNWPVQKLRPVCVRRHGDHDYRATAKRHGHAWLGSHVSCGLHGHSLRQTDRRLRADIQWNRDKRLKANKQPTPPPACWEEDTYSVSITMGDVRMKLSNTADRVSFRRSVRHLGNSRAAANMSPCRLISLRRITRRCSSGCRRT